MDMNPIDTKTPVLVLNCKIGGLAIMRSLGQLGIAVHGIDSDAKCPGFRSRYCAGRHRKSFLETGPEEYLDFVIRVGKGIGKKPILIPTSDELAVFVSEHGESLAPYFLFPWNDPNIVRGLISKKGMYDLALKHGVPTPGTLFPETAGDIARYAEEATFPVMLKGIHGNRLQDRTGIKMVIARNGEELIEHFARLDDPGSPNLMVQEYIPGGDDSIHIFNGYFDAGSECRAAFTGHKIRQYPVHVGCASLGICRWNQAVSDTTVRFMRELGYRGILDIGYRWDPRDGQYKVLDINPRVGQAFRLFLGTEGMDVVKALYLDLTGQGLNSHPVPKEGRRWLIEDYDIESSIAYFREGTLSIGEWIASFKGVEEGAWFNWRDPVPFLYMGAKLAGKTIRWAHKKLLGRRGGRMTPAGDAT
jgi:D-aspartate ligase